MTPRASLVVPLLRQVDSWLEQCLESAFRQSVPCEVIVVTSPHTPASNRQILHQAQAKRPGLRVIERSPHMRFAAALNLGIRSAAAQRIGFLLTDDWMEPKCVETCLAFDADIVSTGFKTMADDGVTVLSDLEREHSPSGYSQLTKHSERAGYLTHFFLFRRQALEAIGGVDETIGDSPGIDDFDLIWCLLENGASVTIVEERLYNYRDHSGERLTTRKLSDMLDTFNRILNKHHVDADERKDLMEAHARWFGKSMTSIYREVMPLEVPALLRPLQNLYRAMIPMRIRLSIGSRLRRK